MKLHSLRWIAGCVVFGLFTLVLASGDAAELLKSVADFRMGLTKEAQEKQKAGGARIDFAAIDAKVKAKAKEAVKNVDPSKVDLSEALAWAQLFNLAGQWSDSQVVLTRYIESHPDAESLFEAETMLASACSMSKDWKGLAVALQSLKPYNAATTVSLVSYQCTYAPLAAASIGPAAAVALIDDSLRLLDAAELTDALKSRAATLRATAIQSKVDIYKGAGRRDLALKVLEEAIAHASPESQAKLVTLRNQMTLVGSPAPSLVIERGYGEYAELGAMKGKVVILDFFAHWCGPCVDAFPEMSEMYAELRPQGLEMMGVTTYYGYLGDLSIRLTPDEEFAKMKAFMQERKMTWPVVFGTRENFTAYGVTAIPHVVVIGRDGVVRRLEIGYSPETFAKFRKAVEDLLAQK